MAGARRCSQMLGVSSRIDSLAHFAQSVFEQMSEQSVFHCYLFIKSVNKVI